MRYNDYDDELERMRSRKSRTAGRRPAGERPVRETARQRAQYRDEPEDVYKRQGCVWKLLSDICASQFVGCADGRNEFANIPEHSLGVFGCESVFVSGTCF